MNEAIEQDLKVAEDRKREVEACLDVAQAALEQELPSFVDHDLAFWPVGASRFVYWVLRWLGEDVYPAVTDGWVWNTGTHAITFAGDWDPDMDTPIIISVEAY